MQSYIEIIRLSNIEHQSPQLPQCAFRHQRQRETTQQLLPGDETTATVV